MIDRAQLAEVIYVTVLAQARSLAERGLWIRDDFGAPNVHAVQEITSRVQSAVLALVGPEVERLRVGWDDEARRHAETITIAASIRAERDRLREQLVRLDELVRKSDSLTENGQLREQVRVLREALLPFASGGDWGRYKAWLVEGTRVMDKVSEGLDAAQAITRHQVAVDNVLARTAPEPS